MIKSLKKMYKEYGHRILPYVELLLMTDREVENKQDYYLDEYQQMGWLKYEGTGPFLVTEIKDPEELFPIGLMARQGKRPAGNRKKDSVLDWFVENWDVIPSDFYISGSNEYSPKYRKFAKQARMALPEDDLLRLYKWVQDNQEDLKPYEIYQLLSIVHIRELERWRLVGIPTKKKDPSEGLADREWE